jgi:hypothetical protein
MNFIFKKESVEVDSWLANMDEAEMERSIGEAALALKVTWSTTGIKSSISQVVTCI